MFVVAAMTPIGAGLHDPVTICRPFVRGLPSWVAQKLMKLLEEVREGTWPASGTFCPSFSKPVAMTELSSVSEDWTSAPPAALPAAALSPAAAVLVA